MSGIISAFISALPPGAKRSGRGWINFNCPLCGDQRGRCGFLETNTGGFRIRCFNAACPLNDAATGWEPGSGLGGKPKLFFTSLGGNLKDLPLIELTKQSTRFDKNGKAIASEVVNTKFETCNLPEGSVLLDDALNYAETEIQIAGLTKVIDYLVELGQEIIVAHKYFWTPKQPFLLIIPFFHYGKIVGWQGKNFANTSRFYGQVPSNYIFRQDTIERGTNRSAIVMEGVMNSIAVRGLATRNSSITKKQEQFLNSCGQQIIVLPDMNKTGLSFVQTAQKNNWLVAIPDWDHGIKDTCDAVKKYGVLYTIESIVAYANTNYIKAKAILNMRN